MSRNLPVRWSHKKGDLILYRTVRGKVKEFWYGKQTWYGHPLPRRAFRFFRYYKGGRRYEYRDPGLSEIITKTFCRRRSRIAEAITQNNPLLNVMKKHGRLRQIDGGRTISEEIKYK